MNEIKLDLAKFKGIKTKVFFYGVCTDDRLMDTVEAAEKDGCEFLQVVAGMMMPPRSPLAIPNAQEKPIQVLKVLVRAPESAYKALVAKAQKEAGVN